MTDKLTPHQRECLTLDRLRHFQIATLLNVHKLPLESVVRMTPAQVQEVAFHPRDKQGALVPPTLVTTPAEERLARFRSQEGWDPVNNPMHRATEQKLLKLIGGD